jgi:S-adenosylmethionine hydrolase
VAWTSEEDVYVFVVVIDPGYTRRPVMLIPVSKVLVCPDDAGPGKRCYIPSAKAKELYRVFSNSYAGW